MLTSGDGVNRGKRFNHEGREDTKRNNRFTPRKLGLRNSLAERKESCLLSPGHSGAALISGRPALFQQTGGEKIEESFETFATFG